MRTLFLIILSILCLSANAQKVDSLHKADFAVLSKTQLLNALSVAQPGQTVYVSDTLVLDMSDTVDVRVPTGVMLLSNGATIKYSRTFLDKTYRGLFVADTNSYIGCDQQCEEGFRFIGYNCSTNEVYENGTRLSSNAVRIIGPGVTLRGNVFECWGKWAVDVVHNERGHIVQNVFATTRENGYGYGVWLRGAPHELDSTEVTVIEGNIFFRTRNAVDRGSQPFSSYIARYNASYGATQAHFETHQSGGHDTWIINNLCMTPGPCAHLKGDPEGVFVFEGNVVNNWTMNSAFWVSGGANKDSSNVVIGENVTALGRGY